MVYFGMYLAGRQAHLSSFSKEANDDKHEHHHHRRMNHVSRERGRGKDAEVECMGWMPAAILITFYSFWSPGCGVLFFLILFFCSHA